MSDDGTLKDDVKVPEGEVGDKITKFFNEDGKDTSKHTTDRAVRKGKRLTNT